MKEMVQPAGSLLVLDWASISWVLLLAGLTCAAIAVKNRYAQIAQAGGLARALAHVVVGYFGVGMCAFGAWAMATMRFPVPGGAAWEGVIAVAGGLSAAAIGACTLIEHVLAVAQHARRTAEATVPVE